jgi:hypothetical protein
MTEMPFPRRPFPAHLDGPERLVAIGFRCWMAGYQTGDIACWEHAWNIFASELGPAPARAALTDLSCWVRKIHATSGRSIETYPAACRGFCRDECVAVAMVAASQHHVCPALRACTFALLGGSQIEEVVSETDVLAATLATLDQVLSPATVHLATDGTPSPSARRH